jgi:hypothetical protein
VKEVAMVTQIAYPAAPPITERKATLLDTATVTDDFAWLDGRDLFDSYNAMTFQSAAAFCAPNTKTFTQTAGYQSGWRFAAYGGVLCKTVGLDQAEMKARVAEVFEAGESTAVERAMMSTRFVVSNPAGLWPAPTDITPVAGAVKPGVGIAMLEGYASSVYVGMPTLHIPVVIGSLILGVDGAEFNGDVLQTKLGSKVAVGAGYDYPNNGPTGAAAPTGERWLYATGEVFIGRSEVNIQQAVNYSTNEVLVLGERGYIVAVDSFAAAVRVTVNA